MVVQMRIALVQSFLPSRSQGGVGHFTDQLANRLVERGHDVTVFSLDPAPAGAAYDVVQPGPDVRLVRGRLGRTYGFGIWLGRQDFSGFDVLHAMGDNYLLRTRTPVVRTLHGSALGEALHAPRLVTKAFFASIYPLEILGAARATRTAVISTGSLKHFPFLRAETIPNAVADTFFRPNKKRSAAPSILFVGHRLRDRKRGFLLVDAFQRVIKPALPNAELWLVCDDRADEAGVQCFSNLDIESLAGLYRRAWVFCLPSSYEGFGRPYVEAMASGTPVVATPNLGALEVLAGGQYGVIASASRLGEELLSLLMDRGRREALAAKGLLRAQDFRWDRVVARYEALYAEVVAGKAASGSDGS